MKPCLLMLWFSAAVPDATLVEEVGSARLLVNVPQQDGSIALKFSEMLEVIVEVHGGPALEVQPPSTWTLSPGWKIKDVSRPALKKVDHRRVWRQTFALDPLAPGVIPVQLEELRYRDNPDEPLKAVTFKVVLVKVTPQLPGGDLKDLREQTPIEELPPPPASEFWLYCAIAGVSAVMGFALAWLLLRHRRVRALRSRSPLAVAWYELGRLKALGLPAKGNAEEFHTLLANVVRRFLEKKYGLPARRTTTQEFSVLLEQAERIPAAEKEFLRKFLDRCDHGKFAGVSVPAEECAELERQAEEFLRRVGI